MAAYGKVVATRLGQDLSVEVSTVRFFPSLFRYFLLRTTPFLAGSTYNEQRIFTPFPAISSALLRSDILDVFIPLYCFHTV